MDMKRRMRHRSLDTYQLYELEHKPHILDKVPSIAPNPYVKKPVNNDKHGKQHRLRDAYDL
ncbi:hypothetical protein OROGR_023384 [Orobanche gracilis]